MTLTTLFSLDFTRSSLIKKLKEHSPHNHPLKKALGRPLQSLRVLDATAGFLEDAFLMASWGCEVTALERNHELFDAVSSALAAIKDHVFLGKLAQKINYLEKDSLNFLNQEHSFSFEVIHLDPMYPEKKKTALSKQKMRQLKSIVGEDHDYLELLEKSISANVERIILKRPLKSETLISEKCVATFKGKATRYDLYLGKGCV